MKSSKNDRYFLSLAQPRPNAA